jgi:hypothetical protein
LNAATQIGKSMAAIAALPRFQMSGGILSSHEKSRAFFLTYPAAQPAVYTLAVTSIVLAESHSQGMLLWTNLYKLYERDE